MDLKQLVEDYRPSSETIETVGNTRLMFLVGIAGAGKNTLASSLLKNDDFTGIISHTTRSPRVNNGISEVDGVNYHFIDDAEAERMILAKEFVEVKYVHGTIYGTSVQSVREIHDSKKIGMTDIDIQGVDEYKQMSSRIIPIFILPPDYETWKKRFMSRYDGERVPRDDFERRKLSAVKELEHVLSADYYHFVVNDNKDRAGEVIQDIASGDISHAANERVRELAQKILQRLQD